ncbi:MAG: hypothetical protein HC845_00085 [Akkermansiaceae bacterium]|nr:hypothetical protein [Akkermansiaceae bacterium]
MINERPTLTIVSNADEKFFPGLAVAVTSAVAAASGKYNYDFIILDGGLKRSDLSKLESQINQLAAVKNISVGIEYLEITESQLKLFPERRGSRMTYAKLVLPQLLSRLDSIIYLDADVLCFKGIESVHPPDGDKHWLLAGARDFFGTLEKDCPWLAKVSLTERSSPYINCRGAVDEFKRLERNELYR